MTPAEASWEWLRCKHYIEAALAHGPALESIGDVERLISAGQYHFWPAEQSAVITEFVQYPNAKALMIRHAGGDLKELKSLRPSIEAFAKANGCELLAAEGRKGWERVFRNDGYRFAWAMYLKDLK